MRYNLFFDLHTPLRLTLLKTCVSINNFNLVEAGTGTTIKKDVAEVIAAFEEQLLIEERYILPLVFEYEPSIADSYYRQHTLQTFEVRRLKSLLSTIADEDTGETTELGDLARAFNNFVMINYNHMDDEEMILNQLLWIYYDDEFLRQVYQKTIRQTRVVYETEQRQMLMTATAA